MLRSRLCSPIHPPPALSAAPDVMERKGIMTQINRIYGNSGLNMVRPDQRVNGTAAKSPGVKPQDQVEISEAAQYLSDLQQPGIRMDKVEKARQAIALGNYETPDKIEVVVDRILREINAELDR